MNTDCRSSPSGVSIFERSVFAFDDICGTFIQAGWQTSHPGLLQPSRVVDRFLKGEEALSATLRSRATVSQSGHRKRCIMSEYSFQRATVGTLTISIAVGLTGLATNAWAAPIAGEPIQVRQPDGTTFVAIPGGDEWVNWVSSGGFLIAQDDAGWWRYADLKRGTPEPVAALVGIDRPPADAATLADIPAWAASVKRPSESFPARPQIKGRSTTEQVLIILVAF